MNIEKKITDIWLVGTEPTLLSIRIQYKWWKITWTLIKSTEISPYITIKEIEQTAQNLLTE